MKVGIHIVFFIFLLAKITISGAYELEGEWEMDVKKTVDFNEVRSGISKEEREVISCVSILMRIEKSFIYLQQDYRNCGDDRSEYKVGAINEKWKYKEIFNRNRKIVIEVLRENGHDIEVINFMGPKLFWIYYGGRDESSDEHVRYYYRKK